ncbi:MAG: AMP-binding protein, partial [Actinomycetota bacterium]|nr:AMP-binding protein [Actinomycetota bacterium]
MTAAELFLRNADSDEIGAHFEDLSFSFRELATESRRRAALWAEFRDPTRPPHIGVLLDNTPEYLFWLGAAAISRSVVVGINATYRGNELARLIDHCDCQIVVTSAAYEDVLRTSPHHIAPERVFGTHTSRCAELLVTAEVDRSWEPALRTDPYLLIFTSGSTGFPKAVRCTQGRFAKTGAGGAAIGKLGPGRAVYAPLPMFHSSALFTGLSSALNASAPFGTRSKFSASRSMSDIHRMGATMLAYTGKILNYILATPPSPADASSPLELALGNEASESDIRAFAARFSCRVRDSYGSTEGLVIIRRESSMPPGALGTADAAIAVYDPATGEECARARFDPTGRLLNADEAVGEIVNTRPGTAFEGYYRNEEAVASKVRDGIYWSGDLAYRDEEGWFYFAGRSNEWLRVDSENFAAAPVERIVGRYPQVRSVAVYAVPDERVGDRVMVAIEVDDVEGFDVEK